MKKLFILLGLVLIVGCADEKTIGGETDEHGCLGPAGYQWCPSKQKCMRMREEYCEEFAEQFKEEFIESFEDCANAGFPVLESYPRQCQANGKTFIEEVEIPVEEPVIIQEELTVKEIQVTAKRYEFIPSTITVNKGEKVKLIITSIDVTHGFRFKTPFIDINEQLSPNNEVMIEFTATESGEYDFWCSVYCGAGHGGMRGKLVVE